jgi:putative transposase
MPTPSILKAAFHPEQFYHIVTKSIDGILLFNEDQDYSVFLERFRHFTGYFLEVLSYSLQSNHTHHIVYIKPVKEILETTRLLDEDQQTKVLKLYNTNPTPELFDKIIERQMNSLLVSYSKFCNNKYNRKGGIFQKPFKRIEIADESYLQQAIIYVNANAQKHKLVTDFKNWHWNAYEACINNDAIYINTRRVLNFFGGRRQFIETHTAQVANYYSKAWPNSKLE